MKRYGLTLIFGLALCSTLAGVAAADDHPTPKVAQLLGKTSGSSVANSPPAASIDVKGTPSVDNPAHLDLPAWIQAGSAVVMLIFTALLVWIGFRQAAISAKQGDIAEEQRSLAALQTDLLVKQKEIARQGHLATHRPRLTVRNVVLEPRARSWPGQPQMIVGELSEGHLYVVNRGGSEAQITNALIIVHHQENSLLPMKPPYEGMCGNTGPMSSRLLAGKSVQIPIGSGQQVGQDKAVAILNGQSPDTLYVMGWVEYQDGSYDLETDSQLTRRTAFCRKFDIASRRFVRVDDEDYEYEE